LARHEPALDLQSSGTEDPTPAAKSSRRRRSRTLVIYAHLAQDAIAGIENTRTIASVEQIRSWCTDPDTQITLRPVLDLNSHRHTTAYRPTEPIREHVSLTHPTCVFPGCTRPSRGCDLDHIVPYDQGGPTCPCNLAPLCRLHHRLKTHGGWRYHPIGPNAHHGYHWTSPMGQTYWRHP
jgi:hypothetical protein